MGRSRAHSKSLGASVPGSEGCVSTTVFSRDAAKRVDKSDHSGDRKLTQAFAA